MLDIIEQEVFAAGFVPIIADQFALLQFDLDVHDVTLHLLHACRLAIFELSGLSGALMEVERCSDYGIRKALVLYQDPFNRQWPVFPLAWDTTAMVKSLVREQSSRFAIRPYARPANAASETKGFLTAIKRSAYGKLHNL